jgi:hypothetical protein
MLVKVGDVWVDAQRVVALEQRWPVKRVENVPDKPPGWTSLANYEHDDTGASGPGWVEITLYRQRLTVSANGVTLGDAAAIINRELVVQRELERPWEPRR